MLTALTIDEFLARTASADPVPGGGSISALTAAAAAALVEMVAQVTLGKKGFASVDADMRRVAAQAAGLRPRLAAAVDADAAAFNRVMAAVRLPKSTETQQNERRRAVQAALKGAVEVPLQTARDALQLLDLAQTAVQIGNPNAVTDGLVAAMTARTAVCGALYNAAVNLKSIQDEAYRAGITREVKALRRDAEKKEAAVRAVVEQAHALLAD